MRRLSSSLTFFYKRVFPVLWGGFMLTVFGLQICAMQHAHADAPARSFLPLVLMSLFLTGVMFLLYRKLLFDLLDEVWLDGDYLVVKNRSEKIRVALSDVMNVNASTMTNPRRVTLMLRTDSRCGRNLTSIPASPRGFLSALKPDPIATELIERVDALRRVSR